MFTSQIAQGDVVTQTVTISKGTNVHDFRNNDVFYVGSGGSHVHKIPEMIRNSTIWNTSYVATPRGTVCIC